VLVDGLVGKRAVIEYADDYELVLRLDDGRVLRVLVEVDCEFWDGNTCVDEDWDAYLVYEVVKDE